MTYGMRVLGRDVAAWGGKGLQLPHSRGPAASLGSAGSRTEPEHPPSPRLPPAPRPTLLLSGTEDRGPSR